MLLVVFAVTICRSADVRQAAAAWPDGYDQRYIDAVNDASFGGGAPDYWLNPAKVVRNLTVITDTNPNLIWQEPGKTHLLMGSLLGRTNFDRNFVDNAFRSNLWLTAGGELQSFLQQNTTPFENQAVRTKQVLGMPTNHNGDRVIEFWINRSAVFRPTKTGDVTDPVSPLDGPWASKGYTFLRDWWQTNYVTNPAAGYAPYPFTGMGYTYDWGTSDPLHQGLTEFIGSAYSADPVTHVEVSAAISIGSYRYYDHATGNFDVNGDADTIWAGLRYTPLGNQVLIRSEGVVYQGITVSSSGYTIINQGTLLGPGRNFDNTLREAVVEFEAGGRLQNSGLISGPVGVRSIAGDTTVENTGVIEGEVAAIDLGGGTDTVTSSGTIRGDILTGAGDDALTFRGGSFLGNADGGTGTNTLTFDVAAGQVFTAQGDFRNFATTSFLGGTSQLDGILTSPSVSVAQSATLAGTLRIEGDLTSAGTLSPGDSAGGGSPIGTMRVTGNYTQQTTGQLIVEMNKVSAGTYRNDNVIVGGSATLQSGSKVFLRNIAGSTDAYRPDDTFTVYTASTPFASNPNLAFESDSAFLSFVGVNPTGKNIYQAKVVRSALFASAAQSDNQFAVAHALDLSNDLATGAFAELVNELLFMNSLQFSAAASQLSPAPYFAIESASQRNAQYLAESLSEYLFIRRLAKRQLGFETPLGGMAMGSGPMGSRAAGIMPVSNPSDAAAAADRMGGMDSGSMNVSGMNEEVVLRQQSPAFRDRFGFFDPYAAFFGEKSRGEHIGYNAKAIGSQFGVDGQFDDSMILGFSIYYSNIFVAMNDQRGSGTIDTLRIGPYMTSYGERWFLDSWISCGFSDNDVRRSVHLPDQTLTAQATYSAADATAYLGGGAQYDLGDAILMPLASLQYYYYTGHRFTESGAGGANLNVLPQNGNSLNARLGGRLLRVIDMRFGKFVPEVFGGWAHECLGGNQLVSAFAAGSPNFIVDSGGIFPNNGYYGGVLRFSGSQRSNVFLRYTGSLAGQTHFNALDLGVAIGF
jgi:uncharacterized protein with beta-barrel porin domain